jgi:hypothetical protein
MTSGRTVTIGQRSDVFPERDAHVEIQDIPQNRITLGTRRILQGGSLPSPDENEDNNNEQQRVEDRDVNHGDKGGAEGRRVGSYTTTAP